MNRDDALELFAEIERRKRSNLRICQFFPDTGPYRRELYPKHLAFMKAGAVHRERLFLKANRVGGTEMGALECTLHLTGRYGEYAPWWEGKRFDGPIKAWVAGDTGKTTRDILQFKLFGKPGEPGTGMMPDHLIAYTRAKQGLADGFDSVYIQHVSGGYSLVQFKCHPAGSRVLMADGSWRAIETIRLGDEVRLASGAVRPVVQTHAYANAGILHVRTRSGEFAVTDNHRCHTVNRGWIRADEVATGDVVTVASADWHSGEPAEEWRVCLTALMIGDGCTRGRTPFFTCNEPPIVEMVRALLPPDLHVVPMRGTISYKISSSLHKHNRLQASLRHDGLWALKSREKFIPPWVFRLPRPQRVLFLRWLFGCDGTINDKVATYASASRRLADDVRLLLWSVGIQAPVSHHRVGNQSGKRFDAYYIALHGENRLAFSEIGKLNRDSAATVTPRPKGPRGEVLAVTRGLSQDVYCVGVDHDHELIVEGYRLGNSFDQGRRAFQGTEQNFVWLDEEAPADVYGECLLRTAATGEFGGGLIILTFTPLNGLTPLILDWLPGGQLPETTS